MGFGDTMSLVRDLAVGGVGPRAIAEFAESDHGQSAGELYSDANVTGPTEFGQLPE